MQLTCIAVILSGLASLAVASDTTVNFGKIDSGAAGMKLTSISSQKNDDGEGRFAGFALVEKSDAVRLDLVKMGAMSRPEPGLKLETTTAVTDGSSDANVISGNWQRPNVIPSVGASNGYYCSVSWTDAIGILPQPDGANSFFDGYYCTTSSASCTPGTIFSRYFGTGGPDLVNDGERICYNAGIYGYSNSGGVNYSIQGETSVACTNICS